MSSSSTAARAIAACAVLAAGLATSLAAAAQTPPEPAAPPMRMPASDAEFVRMLDRANRGELELAKLVVNRTKDPAVHQYAQRMIDDHSTAAVKLEAATRGTDLAPARGAAATGPASRGRATARLQAETGTQLDAHYMRIQVPAHRRALGLLQWESQNGTNAGLKALATALAPTVQQHLQLAQSYLAAHNLTPYGPPDVMPVPGNVNPQNRGAGPGPGIPNNPAAAPNGGSTSGSNNGSGGTQPNPSGASPTPAPSASPHR